MLPQRESDCRPRQCVLVLGGRRKVAGGGLCEYCELRYCMWRVHFSWSSQPPPFLFHDFNQIPNINTF